MAKALPPPVTQAQLERMYAMYDKIHPTWAANGVYYNLAQHNQRDQVGWLADRKVEGIKHALAGALMANNMGLFTDLVITYDVPVGATVACLAARVGNLPLLKRCVVVDGMPLDVTLFRAAVAGGQVHIMQWLHDMECRYNHSVFLAAIDARVHSTPYTAQWLHDHGYAWTKTGYEQSDVTHAVWTWLQNTTPCAAC
jgi:hypothetical protein